MEARTFEFMNRISQTWLEFDTVYFGGGTPSAISTEYLSRFLQQVHKTALITEGAEVTAEANPSDVGQFDALFKAGVRRLSLGIQSTNERVLRSLGRTHKAEDAAKAIEGARRAGFINVSIDLIFGAPGQTTNEWQCDLEQILSLAPNHISIYGLTIEPGTPFAKQHAFGDLALPVEDDQAAMYDIALQLTKSAGLNQYELSNFARPGFESRHNLSCWRGDTYMGLGLSAHSYDGSTRSWNIRSLNEYLKRIEENQSPVESSESIGEETRSIERIMLGLRTRDGIDSHLVHNEDAISKLVSENLIQRNGDRITLTRQGKVIADSVCEELVRDL